MNPQFFLDPDCLSYVNNLAQRSKSVFRLFDGKGGFVKFGNKNVGKAFDVCLAEFNDHIYKPLKGTDLAIHELGENFVLNFDEAWEQYALFQFSVANNVQLYTSCKCVVCNSKFKNFSKCSVRYFDEGSNDSISILCTTCVDIAYDYAHENYKQVYTKLGLLDSVNPASYCDTEQNKWISGSQFADVQGRRVGEKLTIGFGLSLKESVKNYYFNLNGIMWKTVIGGEPFDMVDGNQNRILVFSMWLSKLSNDSTTVFPGFVSYFLPPQIRKQIYRSLRCSVEDFQEVTLERYRCIIYNSSTLISCLNSMMNLCHKHYGFNDCYPKVKIKWPQ